MKKQLKAVISVLLALVLFASSIPVGAIDAFAAEKLTKKIEYDYFGTAFVTMIPGNPDNYITYTTDGVVPDAKSQKYDGEISVYEETTFRIAEYTPDGKRVKGIKFTVKPKLAPVTFKVAQLGDKAEVTLNCMTAGAEIRYTTDGSKPTQESALYTEAIVLTEKTKIRARAYCEGFKTSATYGKTVKITPAESIKAEEEKQEEQPEKPQEEAQSESKTTDGETAMQGAETSDEKVVSNDKVISKVTYNTEHGYAYLALTPKYPSNTIRYTTDGSTPTKKSPKYKKRLTLKEACTVRVREYNKAGEVVGSAKLNIKVRCAAAKLTCVDIDIGISTLTMETETEGALIYYTTDGTEPDPETAKLYMYPISVKSNANLKIVVIKEGYLDSSVTSVNAGNLEYQLSNFNFEDPKYKEVLNLINKRRAEEGLAPLYLDEDLTKAANIRAKEISLVYGHMRPSGASYTSAVIAQNVACLRCAEMILSSCNSAQDFVNRAVFTLSASGSVLDKDFYATRVGVGYYQKGETGYWVLLVAD